MSRLPFELFLALRYLRPKRTFVSVITLISILGVSMGVAVLLIVISVMSGFDHDLRRRILGFNPQLGIIQTNGTEAGLMKNYEVLADKILANKNVRSVAPFIVGPVLVRSQGMTNHPTYQGIPALRGMNPATDGNAGELSNNIVAGYFDLSGRGMVVGAGFAQSLHLQVGDHVSVYTADEYEKMQAAWNRNEHLTILPDDYEVRGIFNVGYYEYDSRFVITSLGNAQDLYGLNDSVQGLFVTLTDPYLADEVKAQLLSSLGEDFQLTTWMEESSVMLNALKVEKDMMFYLLFFIMLVAALCILSAQITFVIQKTREIGMLKALGATRWQISGIFFVQSAIIGFVGVAAGYGLGMLAVTYRNEFLHFMRHVTGKELFNRSIYSFSDLPALVTCHDVLIICISSFVICILGGLLPAVRAGSLKPVAALRYE